MISGTVLLFGLVIGSFLNVCIARLPQERSIVNPPSQCPRCNTPIAWFDNIPVLSFLALRGRCRQCGLPISWRYPLVELLNGLLFLACFVRFGLTGEGALAMALCSALVVITFIDLDHMIIPHVITKSGIVIGILVAPFFMTALAPPMAFGLGRFLPAAHSYNGDQLILITTGVVNSLAGMLLGGLPLFLIGEFWERVFKKEAMGGGDVWFMGMVGSFLGWKGAFLIIMLGALAGSAVGIILIALKRHELGKLIPFGPYLALGTLFTLFFGEDILSWYFGMLHL